MTRPIIRAIDTETTGLLPAQGNRLCQIGAADLHPDDKICRNIVRYVNPGPIDPAITFRPKLTERALERGKSPAEAAKVFKGAAIYAMHKADFDWPILEPLLGPAQTICTLKCALVFAPKAKDHTCSNLYIALTGQDPGKIHKAGKDSFMAATILSVMLRSHSVEELIDISAQDVIWFGIYKGNFWHQVAKTDPAYLDWIAKKSSLDEATKALAQKYVRAREAREGVGSAEQMPIHLARLPPQSGSGLAC